MPRYGFRDENGEVVETAGVAVALWPEKPKVYGFYCKSGHYCKLKPVNKNITEGLWWECQCKCISLTARDRCFNFHRKIALETFNLNNLSYDVATDHWEIEGEWTSHDGNRLTAVKRKVGPTEKEEILDKLADVISQELGVTFEDWSNFFAS
jgi:hypothetical protein